MSSKVTNYSDFKFARFKFKANLSLKWLWNWSKGPFIQILTILSNCLVKIWNHPESSNKWIELRISLHLCQEYFTYIEAVSSGMVDETRVPKNKKTIHLNWQICPTLEPNRGIERQYPWVTRLSSNWNYNL